MRNSTSNRKRFFIISIIVVLLCTASFQVMDAKEGQPVSKTAGGLPAEGVKLTIQNPTAMDYAAQPVTSGVPLPEGAGLVDEKRFVLKDIKGRVVPAQFRVLSRWGALNDSAKPIKWVLVDLQADVAGKSSVNYFLHYNSAAASYHAGIQIRENKESVSVDTGAIAFSISKQRFALFEQVVLAGEKDSLVERTNENGIVIKRNKNEFSSAMDKPEVVIEEQGPMRSVIRIKGKFRDKGGNAFVGGDARMYLPQSKITPAAENYPLSYTVRIHAYKGKSFVKMYYTLENNGNTIAFYYPVNDVFIDGNYLRLKPAAFGSAVSVTSETGSFNAAKGDVVELLQTYKLNDPKDESKNFAYKVMHNSKEAASGKRSQGWMDFSSSTSGIAVGTKFFWQKYPKSIELTGNAINLGILPENGVEREASGPFAHYTSGNHYFSGGWHKTTELFWYFHKGSADKSDVSAAMDRLQSPLFARCDAHWLAKTKAWGLIAPAKSISSENRLMKDAFDRYEQFQEMFIDKKKERLGRDIVSLRETRSINRTHYGWEHFGDMAHGWSVFSSLIYDWPYIMWLQFARSGDLRFMDRAIEMTQHSIDMDQIHYYVPAKFSDGIWHFESIGNLHVNYHHKALQGGGAIVSHTWNGGYALGYLLTGDNRYLEAAKRSAHVGRAFWSWKERNQNAIAGQKVKFDQTRSQGWTILMLVNEYRITGDINNLKQAMAIFKNSLLYTEQLPENPGSRGRGYILVEKYPDPKIQGRAVVTFLTYPLEPLCELHYEATKAGLEALELERYLIRSLSWLKDYAFVGGRTNSAGQYSLFSISYATDPVNSENNNGGEIAHNIHMAGAFGYMAAVLKNKEPQLADDYLKTARQLFRDLMLYKDTQKTDKASFINPSSYSPVGWGWLPTAPKTMGYIGRGGQHYLNIEYELQGGKSDERAH